METLKKNKILSGVFVITALVFIYYFVIPSGNSAVPPTIPGAAMAGGLVPGAAGTASGSMTPGTQGPGTTEAAATSGDDITVLFQRLGSASIDTSIFTSAVWMSLNDISTPVPTDPSGKADPFAPIGVGQTGGQQFSSGATVNATTTKK